MLNHRVNVLEIIDQHRPARLCPPQRNINLLCECDTINHGHKPPVTSLLFM